MVSWFSASLDPWVRRDVYRGNESSHCFWGHELTQSKQIMTSLEQSLCLNVCQRFRNKIFWIYETYLIFCLKPGSTIPRDGKSQRSNFSKLSMLKRMPQSQHSWGRGRKNLFLRPSGLYNEFQDSQGYKTKPNQINQPNKIPPKRNKKICQPGLARIPERENRKANTIQTSTNWVHRDGQ